MPRKKKEVNEVIPKKTKPKKEQTYRHIEGDSVIYIGNLYEQYHNCEGIIIDKSKTHQTEYYKVKFADGRIVTLAGKVLKEKTIIATDIIKENE